MKGTFSNEISKVPYRGYSSTLRTGHRVRPFTSVIPYYFQVCVRLSMRSMDCRGGGGEGRSLGPDGILGGGLA